MHCGLGLAGTKQPAGVRGAGGASGGGGAARRGAERRVGNGNAKVKERTQRRRDEENEAPRGAPGLAWSRDGNGASPLTARRALYVSVLRGAGGIMLVPMVQGSRERCNIMMIPLPLATPPNCAEAAL